MRRFVIAAFVTLSAGVAVAQSQYFSCSRSIRVEEVWPQQIAAVANGDRKVEIALVPRDRRSNPLEAVLNQASPRIQADGVYCVYYGPGISARYRWQGDGHLVHCYSKPAVTPEIQWPKDTRQGAQFVEASGPRTTTEDPEGNVCTYSLRGEYRAVYRFAIDTKSHRCMPARERASIDPAVRCTK
ncbi:MAG TPA: hypothetical protein VJ853_11130 [Thermoanaerobaculia bacterium]|jgi:hypothetical protein|nr:hypothetical protein [Thermoanaerobaculia bacterium]